MQMTLEQRTRCDTVHVLYDTALHSPVTIPPSERSELRPTESLVIFGKKTQELVQDQEQYHQKIASVKPPPPVHQHVPCHYASYRHGGRWIGSYRDRGTRR